MDQAVVEAGTSKVAARAAVIDADVDEFRVNFGHKPFQLKHNLAGHPLFSLARLDQAAVRASKLTSNAKFVNNTGLARTGAKFDEAQERERAAGAVEKLPSANAWMKISDICAADPEYRVVLEQLLDDIERFAGRPVRKHISWTQMTVFMASPGVVTPYHIDHEQNILCQISGGKDISLFNPDDRELLPDVEIERFYTGDLNGATYRENMQDHGRIFRLEPGVAVHIPSLGGHWVKNGPDVSISVSVNMSMHDIERRAHVYQMNHYLRKAGIRPRPPGQSAWVDGFKATYLDLLSVHPVHNYYEAIFSGIDRQRALLARAKSLVGR